MTKYKLNEKQVKSLNNLWPEYSKLPPTFTEKRTKTFRKQYDAMNEEDALLAQIGKRLREIRSRSRYCTIKELAKASGINPKTIQRIEHCNPEHPGYYPHKKAVPTIFTLIKLCDTLGIKVQDLIYEELPSGMKTYS